MSRTGAFLVSGAGSGIGKAIAPKLVSEGQFVFGIGRDPGKLAAASRELSAGHFVGCPADLSSSEGCARAVEQLREFLNSHNLRLLGVVNNAGVMDRLPFVDTTDHIWERQFYTNLLSAVRLTRALFPQLKAGAPSSVVNISSSLGLRPIVNTAAYSACKAAMISWSRTVALEWAPHGIRCNSICPGIVDTPIHQLDKSDEKQRRIFDAIQPLGRMGRPSEIAEAAWFLLDEKSAWTTGIALPVDGGISL